MKRVATAIALLVPFGLAVLVGCAAGGADDEVSVEYSTTLAEAGAEDDSVKLPGPSTPSDDDPSSDDKDAGADAGAVVVDAGPKGDGGGGGGGGGGSCSAPTTCEKATHLGSVSGDTGHDTLTRQGSTSEWVTVRVTEDVTGLDPISLWLTATLTSPPGTNYDLFVYAPTKSDPDARECKSVAASSTKSAGIDKLPLEWGETGLFANGEDDSRTLTFEVRHVSGTCDPSQKWTLVLEGNGS